MHNSLGLLRCLLCAAEAGDYDSGKQRFAPSSPMARRCDPNIHKLQPMDGPSCRNGDANVRRGGRSHIDLRQARAFGHSIAAMSATDCSK